jgi:hypothetical protein
MAYAPYGGYAPSVRQWQYDPGYRY